MKKKMTRTARMLSTGGMAGGSKKTKGMTAGGKMMMKPKGMSAGGKQKMPMVKDPDTGKQVPFFTVDDKGKMKSGGMTTPKSKGYFKGGKTMASKMATKGGKRGGKG